MQLANIFFELGFGYKEFTYNLQRAVEQNW